MAQKRPTNVTDQLRALIRSAAVTPYQIAKDTGVSNAALSRFLSGERGLSATALDTLGEYFGWQVTAHAPKGPKTPKAR
jgi:plasmid maintenance system antidote protein VapI